MKPVIKQNIQRSLVSVIVPTRNRRSFFAEAIKSIINQTYKNTEVIVINDGGEDVADIIAQYNSKGNIVYIRNIESKGPASARNAGIGAARGQYIAYLDDDDIYYPDHIETQVRYLENSKYKVAYTDAYRVHMEKDGNSYVVKKKDIPYSYDFDPDLILVQNLFPTLTVMHEKSCLEETGLFDESLVTHEDWDLWIRMSMKFQFAHIKKVTCEFTRRRDGTSTTFEKKDDFLRTANIIQDRYRDSLNKKPWLLTASKAMIDNMRAEAALDYKVFPISILNRPQSICSLISVVIPVKYCGDSLNNLIRMIRSQKKVKDLEVILLSSASIEIIEGFEIEDGARLVRIPESEYNQGALIRSAVQEAAGDYIILLDQEATPVNSYWLYNMIFPFLSYPELALLTCQQLSSSNEELHSLWTRDQMSRSLDYEGDFFYILSSNDKDMYQWDYIENVIKRKIYYFDGIVSCFRRGVIEENMNSSIASDRSMALEARLLLMGKGVGYLRSTGIYISKWNTVKDVFWHQFKDTKESERVPLYFFNANKIEWGTMAANIMGAFDLIRLSISELSKKDYDSLDIIKSFLHTLRKNIDYSAGKIEKMLNREMECGGDETGLLMKGVVGDLQLSSEEMYRFRKNFIIPDFIRRLDELTEFAYRQRYSLRGREKDFQVCLYKIFSQTVGEILGIYFLEMKSLGRFMVEMKRLDRLASEMTIAEVKLQYSGPVKLYEKLKYRKFDEGELKIAVIDFNYFLNREVIRALKSLGHQVFEIRGSKDEAARDILKRMMLTIAKFKPDFLLTINHLGFDEDGIFTSFIDSIELPVAVWYVDSPSIIIRSFGKNVSPYVSIFLWDRFYLKEIRDMGFESVEYLPLATDKEIFRPIKLTSADVNRYSTDIGFVGNSWYQRTQEELEGVPEGLHNIVERLSHIISQSRIPFHEAFKSLSDEESKGAVSLAVRQRLDFEAATYWRATSLYRMSCIQALKELHPVIHGDPDWRRLTGNGYELKQPLNYYKDLPLFYNACKINLNATSLQMLTAVNQRVFDVPACGAFLLTDNQDALGELFDIGKEVITFKNREEIPELTRYYLRNYEERKRISERGRERIVNEHTYVHRINTLIHSMRRQYS